MISIDNPNPDIPSHVLDQPGGFGWWYADVLDEHGTGAVIIWSWGLPFLPGYLSASRAGRPELPGQRPSLNVCVYERGKPAFYVLAELDPSDVTRDGLDFQFGRSTFSIAQQDGETTLRAALNLPMGGSDERLTGSLHLRGRTPEIISALEDLDPRHRWVPLACPATADLDLRAGDFAVRTSGRAYFDRNHGVVPFDQLGIDEWIWGRVSAPSGEHVFYVLDDEHGDRVAFGATFGDGPVTFRPLSVGRLERQRTAFGMQSVEHVELFDGDTLWADVRTSSLVDNGPFYLRQQASGRAAGESGHGTLEVIRPERIDLARHRPLVKMRVTRPRDNSFWLPLFEGSRDGAVLRMMSKFGGDTAPRPSRAPSFSRRVINRTFR